jgi:simple sugar transport system substrate-binding protein
MGRSVAALGAAVAVGFFASGAFAQEPVRACFVYVGPHNDGGWNQGHDTGRLMVEEALGDAVATQYVESVPEGPDAEAVLERLARSGCNIIFTTSFGYMDATLAVAARFPDVKFEHATGFMTAPNVTTYNARFYEGRYIIGQIAAKMSETGIAGYIGSVPIPEVIMGINAFMLGAQSVNPEFQLKIIWINSWADPGREADAAKALFDQNADIITQHTDTTAPLQIAEERGLHGFGQAHDMISFAPNAQYTAIVDNWGPYYVERVTAVIDGTWESTSSWEGLAEGLVEMAPYTNVPEDVAVAAEELEHLIATGEFHPFAGPVTDQDGTLRVPAGDVAADAMLLEMNWYVEGIEDRIPQ